MDLYCVYILYNLGFFLNKKKSLKFRSTKCVYNIHHTVYTTRIVLYYIVFRWILAFKYIFQMIVCALMWQETGPMAKLSHGNRPAVYIMRLLYKERYKVLFSGSVFKLNFHYISLLGNAKKKKIPKINRGKNIKNS